MQTYKYPYLPIYTHMYPYIPIFIPINLYPLVFTHIYPYILITTHIYLYQQKIPKYNTTIIHNRLAHSRVFYSRLVPKTRKSKKKIIEKEEKKRKKNFIAGQNEQYALWPKVILTFGSGCFAMAHTDKQTHRRKSQLYAWIGLGADSVKIILNLILKMQWIGTKPIFW